MPRGQNIRDPGAGGAPAPTLKQRLGSFLLKPPDPAAPPPPVAPRRSVEELEEINRYADDKERLFGLIGAPVGAAIAIMITGAQIAHDHKHATVYTELMWVLLVLTVVMLAAAWFRKRLFLGCAMALYGLAVFNLHYWGFGVPFVLVGAWLLVGAYRAQRELKEATGAVSRYGGRSSAGGHPPAQGANKRYTPRTARPRNRAS